ncbi:MAG: CPBP family intramembrane glutamic endopeptidase, partial [Bacteroidota bacterium]|nr:CPBP family intramembrane glutamic endopeptidase [Bacteroidota bacterium]
MKTNFFQKPLAWVLIVAIAAISGIYVFYNFDKANPMVGLDIQMNRDAALDKAVILAENFHLGPLDFKTAVVFTNDNTFQNFVELEAGGLEKFKEVLNEGLYNSYSWKVRHFVEHETNEVTFVFSPSGESYGFTEKLADAEGGATLEEEEALTIATREVQANWDLDLSAYDLVEKSKEEMESGRIDHSFIYERKDITIGEGEYRLRIKLSGEKLTQIQHFVKIPDEFNRRYAEMRSKNDIMASFGTVGLIVVYGLFGVFIGFFFLLKGRRLVWKPALIWGLIIALGSVFLTTMNGIPLSWFAYDTSTSAGNFLSSTMINAFLLSLGMGAIFALTFMSAEGLGRSAFPRHVQLWKAWGKESGGSLSLFGQTMSGYLFMVIFLAIDVLFYVITKKFGWWSPAGELSDPNILANYMPWFNSIAISLQAGFWEEALCRAIPLAGIVLLTRKSKYRNFWIILVLIVQTLIFGSAHANYPQQPSYARVLEMVIPFIIFGLIYLGYGLIPIIIAHFAIDVFWFSLPLWVAKSPGIWTDRILVLVFLFIPLWIVLYRRLRNRKWTEIPDKFRNIGWEAPEEEIKKEVEKVKLGAEKSTFGKILIPAGIVGIALWFFFTPFVADAPGMEISKQEAEEIAVIALSERFEIDVKDWTLMSNISARTGLTHKFI